jgi:hypothetical protein
MCETGRRLVEFEKPFVVKRHAGRLNHDTLYCAVLDGVIAVSVDKGGMEVSPELVAFIALPGITSSGLGAGSPR